MIREEGSNQHVMMNGVQRSDELQSARGVSVTETVIDNVT